MSKNTNIIIKKDEHVWEPKGIAGKYVELCFRGLGSGALIGGYVGGAIGFTGAVLSPAVIGYGLVRGVRAILRK